MIFRGGSTESQKSQIRKVNCLIKFLVGLAVILAAEAAVAWVWAGDSISAQVIFIVTDLLTALALVLAVLFLRR